MAQARKPTIIFSPGGWHTGASFKPTTDLLTLQDYKCVPLDLPSIGSELRGLPPPEDWNQDVDHIRQSILHELDDGLNVILVVHSYSGTVGSEACKGLDETSRKGEGKQTWVSGLVYLSALVFDIGGWIWEATGGKPFDEKRTIMKGDLCYAADTGPWFYNQCSPEVQAAAQEGLRSHAWKTFFSKVSHTAWREIPSWYLYSTNDQAVPLEGQKAFTSIAGGKWSTMECDSDHSPMVCRPEAVVKIVKKAAGEDV